MSNLGPAFELDAPVPAAPAFTLVGAAEVPDVSARWEVGVALNKYGCPGGEVWDPCSTGTGRNKAASATPVAPGGDYNPFVVSMLFLCSTRTDDALRNKARAVFEASEHFLAENEFWTGAKISGNPHLAQASADSLNAGSAWGPVYALSIADDHGLEVARRRCFIHCEPKVFDAWSANMMVTVRGGVAYSPAGNIIVPGSGYPGTDEAGANPNGTSGNRNLSWIYVTGPVKVLRGDLDILDSYTHLQNDHLIRVERSYAVLFDDCVHAAILVNLPTNV